MKLDDVLAWLEAKHSAVPQRQAKARMAISHIRQALHNLHELGDDFELEPVVAPLPQEYPKQVSVGETTAVVNSAEEEQAFLGSPSGEPPSTPEPVGPPNSQESP
jgi:hypothetical protein